MTRRRCIAPNCARPVPWYRRLTCTRAHARLIERLDPRNVGVVGVMAAVRGRRG